MHGDGRRRIFSGFVFEHDVPRVTGLAEDGDHPPQVSLLLVGAGPFAVDLGLDLDGDGVRGKLGDLSVGVFSAEVSGIEVDAEVRSIHGPDELENLPRRRRDSRAPARRLSWPHRAATSG